jgi:hypothetical protein
MHQAQSPQQDQEMMQAVLKLQKQQQQQRLHQLLFQQPWQHATLMCWRWDYRRSWTLRTPLSWQQLLQHRKQHLKHLTLLLPWHKLQDRQKCSHPAPTQTRHNNKVFRSSRASNTTAWQQ